MFSRISNQHQSTGDANSVYSAIAQLAPGMHINQQQSAVPSIRGWPVTVSVEGIGFSYQLTNDDLFKVFSRYGVVTHVEIMLPEGNSATVFFSAYDEASRAIASLDGKELAGVKGHLRVSWGQLPAMTPSSIVMDSSRTATGELLRKFTCRFEIGIENDKEFQVARRIIGQKGIHMKEIVARTDAKLRLRGRGSGYLEGLNRQESPEPLHLCVSCTTKRGYSEAAKLVSELLERIYAEYREYCLGHGVDIGQDLKVTIREHPLGSGPYPSLDLLPSDMQASGKPHVQGLSSVPTAATSPASAGLVPNLLLA